MEFTPQGLELTRKEASELAEVFDIASGLRNWGPHRQVVREPSDEEREDARRLKKLISPFWNKEAMIGDKMIIQSEHWPAISRVAELALENSQKVVTGLCTPNVCDGYRSEWRPAAYRILAMTAEISEAIKL